MQPAGTKSVLVLLLTILSFRIAFAQYKGNDYAAHMDSLHKALAGAKNDSTRLRTLMDIYLDILSFDSAAKTGTIIDSLAEKTGYRYFGPLDMLRVANFVSSYNPHKAIRIGTKALNKAAAQKDKATMADAYHEIGMAYKNMNDYSSALDNYNKATALAIEAHDSSQMVLNYHDLGWMRKDSAGIQYLETGIAIAEQSKNAYWATDMTQHIGEVYFQMAHFPEALIYSQRGLKGWQELKDTMHVKTLLLNIGDIYRKENNFAVAEHYYDTVLSIVNHDTVMDASCYTGLGIIYLHNNKAKEALASHLKSEALFANLDNNIKLDVRTENYKGLAAAYAALGDFKSAFKYQSLFTHFNDSLSEVRGAEKLAQKQMQYDFDNLQKTKDAELATQKEQKNWFIAGAVLLLLGAFVLINRLLYTRRTKRELEAQSVIIAAEKEKAEQLVSEKEMLIKEIHHRVKNNLEVISSLLELQSEGIIDVKAKAAVIEGKSRVQSIALIHHTLYGTDEVTAVEFKSFVSNLYKQVAGVFKQPGTEVEFQIDANEMMLPIVAAVPIGLILNELLTNSFKYAITKEKANCIKLSLIPQATADLNKIIYHDNGPGLPAGYDISKSSSLGMRVIQLLTKQLGGTFHFYNEEGSKFEIPFKV